MFVRGIYFNVPFLFFLNFCLRTRESSLLDECDIVVDVGGVYNPENHRYDHHQRSVLFEWS